MRVDLPEPAGALTNTTRIPASETASSSVAPRRSRAARREGGVGAVSFVATNVIPSPASITRSYDGLAPSSDSPDVDLTRVRSAKERRRLTPVVATMRP
jgi:hypothetical protein